MQRGSIIRTLRAVHRYLGLFFAPSILFFALSGAIQVFGWHQASWASYVPARWIEVMAQIHKKQTPLLPAPKPQKTSTSSDAKSHEVKGAVKSPASKVVLQYFVVIMSIALMVTTALGIMMAWLYGTDRRTVCAVLLCGTLCPVLVTFL